MERMGERRSAYRVLVGKREGKRPLGRPRRRREGNIKMALQEMGCGGTDWIDLAQDRDRWPQHLIKFSLTYRIPTSEVERCKSNFITSKKMQHFD